MNALKSVARPGKKPKVIAQENPRPHRITVEEYHRMEELGFLPPNRRFELIRGIVVEKPVMNPPHKTSTRRLSDRLRPLIPAEMLMDLQGPITLSDSEPEPDICVSRGPEDRYRNRHAGPADVVLLVEIADSSLEYDRGDKLQLYAGAGIPIYWIVNLPDRVVLVYSQPRDGQKPGYRLTETYVVGDSVPVVIGKKTVGSIPVSEILP